MGGSGNLSYMVINIIIDSKVYSKIKIQHKSLFHLFDKGLCAG